MANKPIQYLLRPFCRPFDSKEALYSQWYARLQVYIVPTVIAKFSQRLSPSSISSCARKHAQLIPKYGHSQHAPRSCCTHIPTGEEGFFFRNLCGDFVLGSIYSLCHFICAVAKAQKLAFFRGELLLQPHFFFITQCCSPFSPPTTTSTSFFPL